MAEGGILRISELVAALAAVAALIVAATVVSRVLRGFRHSKLSRIEPVVAITGCDSGFGLLLCLALRDKGYHVVAGCLTDEGVERLRSVVASAVKCDVTKDEHVAALVKAAEEYIALVPDRRRLWGLVNNAGVGISGPFEWLSVRDFQQSIDVNFMGAVRCCKGFLPLLKRCRGSRIVNITSVAGLVTFRGGSAYNSSKFASEALTEVLRVELEPYGIFVSAVEPSFMRTNIVADTDRRLLNLYDRCGDDVKSQYSRAQVEQFAERIQTFINRTSEDPKQVVDMVAHILQSRSPRMRYLVGKSARTATWFMRYCLPVELGMFLTKLVLPYIGKPRMVDQD